MRKVTEVICLACGKAAAVTRGNRAVCKNPDCNNYDVFSLFKTDDFEKRYQVV